MGCNLDSIEVKDCVDSYNVWNIFTRQKKLREERNNKGKKKEDFSKSPQ